MLAHVPHGQGSITLSIKMEPDASKNPGAGADLGKRRPYCTFSISDTLIRFGEILQKWEIITGRSPEGYIKKLRSYARSESRRTPYAVLKSYDLQHIGDIQRAQRVRTLP